MKGIWSQVQLRRALVGGGWAQPEGNENPKEKIARIRKVPARARTGRKGLGPQAEPSWLAAANMGKDQFLPACPTGAIWQTVTGQRAHCLLKNRQYNLGLELNALLCQARKVFCKDTRILWWKMWRVYQSLEKAKKGPRKHGSLSKWPIMCC